MQYKMKLYSPRAILLYGQWNWQFMHIQNGYWCNQGRRKFGLGSGLG